MEIPFNTVVETEFVNAAPGSGLASFFLSQPPLFYLEDIATDIAGRPPLRSWKRCADWTEGMQASKILRHDLVGSAVQLAYVLRNFQSAPGSDIRLRCLPQVRPELLSAHAMDHSNDNNSVPLSAGLMGEHHHQGYRPPFGGGGGGAVVDISGRDRLVVDVPKRYSFSPGGLHVPLSAPAEATTYGDHLGSSSHSHHLALTDGSSSSPHNSFSSFPLSAASSSSNYSTMSLYPIELPLQRPQSHLGNYAHVSSPSTATTTTTGTGTGTAANAGSAGQSPYIGHGHGHGQGHGFSRPAPPASAPPSQSHFELAPTPTQSSSLSQQPYQQQQQQQQQRHQILGPPSVPVLPFGNGFDTSGQRGE
jgi:regulatory protein PHO2